MKRRNLLIALSGAAGASGLIGTGAFTSVTATRDVTVNVADDTNGYLGFGTSQSANGEFASVSGDEIALDFDTSDGGGSGVGLDSTYNFDDVFTIENQGTQTIYVWANFSGEDLDDDDIWFYPGSDSGRELNDGSNSVVTLTTGQQVNVGVHIDTSVLSSTDDQALTATLNADVDVPDGSQPSDPVGEDAAVVSKDPDAGEFSSIQDAIDAVDRTTVLVESGTYEESVTIDVGGLTLEAADGASPTVDASGIDGGSIPVLVDGVDDVTVDDANIDFNSGIDVGADIGDYPEQVPSNFDLAVFTNESDLNGTKFEGDVGNTAFETIADAATDAGMDDSVLVFPGEYDLTPVNNDGEGVEEGLEWVSYAGPDDTKITDLNESGPNPPEGIALIEDEMVLQGFTFVSSELTPQEMVVMNGNNTEFSHNIIEEGVTLGNHLILVDGGNGIVIDSNEIRDSDAGGPDYPISVTGQINQVNDIEIRNNLITEDIGVAHIALTNADSPVIENNTMRNGNAQGIQITDQIGDVDSAKINRNLFETEASAFLSTSSGNTVNQLNNNHFVGNNPEVRILDIDGLGSPDEDLDADNNWFGTEDRSDIIDNQIRDSGTSSASIIIDPFAGAPIDPDA